MTGFLDTPKRAALRGVAHLLPAKWRQIGDLIDAPIPATPTRRVSAPSDPRPRAWSRSTTWSWSCSRIAPSITCSVTSPCPSTRAATAGSTSTASKAPRSTSTATKTVVSRSILSTGPPSAARSRTPTTRRVRSTSNAPTASSRGLSATSPASQRHGPARPASLYALPSFAHYLDEHDLHWRWYSRRAPPRSAASRDR